MNTPKKERESVRKQIMPFGESVLFKKSKSFLNSLQNRVIPFVLTHKLFFILLISGILALATRVYYSFSLRGGYFYSGDAYGIFLRAFFVSKGYLSPRAIYLWNVPPLILFLNAIVMKFLPMDPVMAVRFLCSIMTTASVLVLVAIVCRYTDALTSLFFGMLLALNPFFSFVSTEPEKAPFVVFFFALGFLFLFKYRDNFPKGEKKYLAWSFVFFMLMMLSYPETGIFFLISGIFIYVLFSWSTKFEDQKKWKILLDPYLYVLTLAGISCFFLRFIPEMLIGFKSQYQEIAAAGGSVAKTAVKGVLFNLRNLFSSNIAASRFMIHIKDHVGVVIFVFSILGLLIFILERRERGSPEKESQGAWFIWAFVIFVLFAVQWWCYSHDSRYPYYLIPPIMFFAAVAVSWFSKKLSLSGIRFVALIITLLLIFSFYQIQKLRSDVFLTYRTRMAAQAKTAEELLHEVKIKRGDGVIALGWPSFIYALVKDEPGREKDLYFVGWGSVDLDVFSLDFIKRRNIRYFVYDAAGSDYYDTPIKLLERFSTMKGLIIVPIHRVTEGNFYGDIYYLEYD